MAEETTIRHLVREPYSGHSRLALLRLCRPQYLLADLEVDFGYVEGEVELAATHDGHLEAGKRPGGLAVVIAKLEVRDAVRRLVVHLGLGVVSPHVQVDAVLVRIRDDARHAHGDGHRRRGVRGVA